ncbi:MAG: hypothetical protein J5518_03905 [Lachnospiraceae bacterium]|nr:hypothetical protein [Lachnospiraceae bacterium]
MKNNSRFPTKLMLAIRVAVGGYLLYLSYSLYKDRAAGSIQPWALALIMAVFVVCAVGVIAHSAYLYMKGMYAGGPADIEVEDGAEEAEQNDDDDSTKALDDNTFSTEDAVDGAFREVDEEQDLK